MDEMMFCYQCEQAANCTACTGKAGVCGKSAETADAQDKLTGALIGFATLLLDIGRPIQPPDVKIGTTIFSKKQKNKPHKVSHWVKTIGKLYAAYSYLF